MINRIFLSLFLTIFLFANTAISADDENEEHISVNQVLQLGPKAVPLPVYHDVENVKGTTFSVDDMLNHDPIDPAGWWPEEGEEVRWDHQESLNWQQQSPGEITPEDENQPNYAWYAYYIETDRWMPVTLHFESASPLRILLNGQQLGTKPAAEPQEHSEQTELPKGKHLVIIKTIYDPENSDEEWQLTPSVESQHPDEIRTSISPQHGVAMRHLSNAPSPGSVSISPDGRFVTTAINRADPPEGETGSWIELRTFDGEPVQDFKGSMEVGAVEWLPDGEQFSYLDRHENGADLWVVNLEDGTQSRVLQDVEQLTGYSWSPDGDYVIYSVSEQPQPPGEVRQLEYLEDRRPGFRRRSFLYIADVEGGTQRRLTAGKLTTNLNSIHPDGHRLLFTRSHIDYTERPYTKTEYSVLDLTTMEVDSLFTASFGGSASWSPDGDKIMVTGGPSMFDEAGKNVPEDMTPNDYDTQLYLYDPEDNSVDPLSREFDPSIVTTEWGPDGSTIYVVTTDQSYRNLYQYNIENRRYTKLDSGVDIVGQFTLAEEAERAIFSGTGISDPPKIYTYNHNRGQAELLNDPAERKYEHVAFGESRDWTFENEAGDEIDGHVYYPPDFDEDEEYPVIVYYYGGTTPVNRAYGGRYPKEYYAAQGYLVYVLQPSGAIGYGQEFSACHVRDWGKIVADEIIDGVGQFLDAHDYADADNVGAIGASYGGFMTMLLQTRTDMFTAAISHAGISNITSYWGEGFWGFQYSAIATAESFPWDDEEIYVDQSPIFDADKITTPLLLLHGNVDTNVPPGESIQMFTALRLLDREVAYVEIDETDHHVLDYSKYQDWTHTILAWFDKHMKGEPDWWEHLHD